MITHNKVEINTTNKPTIKYDLKFFFIFLKKVGPDINPTEPINKIRPIFSKIFKPLADISIFFPLDFCEIVDFICEENIAPYKRAIINTPEEPRLIPLIVILPNKKPTKMQIKAENIKKGIP